MVVEEGALNMCSKESLNRMLEQMSSQLQALFGSHLKNIILYGSYARGEADDDSDVDVLVLVDLPREEIVRYRRAVAKIASEYLFSDNILIAPIIENQAFFEQHQAVLPFYRNIVSEGVRIAA